ncbi:unnamed protein product, partial [Discosporangium mesarthrocarpum]
NAAIAQAREQAEQKATGGSVKNRSGQQVPRNVSRTGKKPPWSSRWRSVEIRKVPRSAVTPTLELQAERRGRRRHIADLLLLVPPGPRGG